MRFKKSNPRGLFEYFWEYKVDVTMGGLHIEMAWLQ